LEVVDEVTTQIRKDHLTDVVTGFGILNEPYVDCEINKYQDFLEKGLEIVRRNLGPDTSVFVSDLFSAPRFNDGEWWLDPQKYNNTYLDSHYYDLFDERERKMSPREHIAQVCDPVPGQNLLDCCWQDGPSITNSTPSEGVGRIVTEWSAAYDAMPGELLKVVLQGIRQNNGVAALWDRKLSAGRKSFLKKFAEAQIISYEQASIPGFNHGWFYWTLKMEGGAFAEWDFLRGLEEGWFPTIQPPTVDSESVYGSCSDILKQTDEGWDIVRAYPNKGDEAYWDPEGLSELFDKEQHNATDVGISVSRAGRRNDGRLIALFATLVVFLFIISRKVLRSRRKWQYMPIDDDCVGKV
jgi:glucan 1,3-beta-glucosidase